MSKQILVMAMSSNYLDAAGLKETFRGSHFKFASTKVPEDEAPNDCLNIQTPVTESALSTSRLHGKLFALLHSIPLDANKCLLCVYLFC